MDGKQRWFGKNNSSNSRFNLRLKPFFTLLATLTGTLSGIKLEWGQNLAKLPHFMFSWNIMEGKNGLSSLKLQSSPVVYDSVNNVFACWDIMSLQRFLYLFLHTENCFHVTNPSLDFPQLHLNPRQNRRIGYVSFLLPGSEMHCWGSWSANYEMVIMDVPKSGIFGCRPEDRELYSLNRLLHRSQILVVDWDPNEWCIVVFPQPSHLDG